MGLGRDVDIKDVGEGDAESLEKGTLWRQRLFTVGADIMRVR